jgi:L-ascorbate metabolism protein UlaG (beta-lactamase superfamily)
MRLTKLEHACVRLEKDGEVLVIDPGTWSGPGVLDGATAILVTHEHFDHLDADRVRSALAGQPGLTLWTNPELAEQFAEFGGRVHGVQEGEAFGIAGFEVHVYGALHALIHRDIPIVANTGFLVDGTVFHPGDALTVPQEDVPVLLLPASAPWLKTGEMIDYAREVNPRQGFAIHDAMLSDKGLAGLTNWLALAGRPAGTPLDRLEPGSTVDLSSLSGLMRAARANGTVGYALRSRHDQRFAR